MTLKRDLMVRYLTGAIASMEDALGGSMTMTEDYNIQGRIWMAKLMLREVEGDRFIGMAVLPTTPAKAHKRGPQTSKDAAASLSAKALKTQHLALLKAYSAAPDGLTNEQLELALGMRAQSVSPRRGELAEAGLVVAVGKRKTTSNREAEVFAITFAGTKALRDQT